MTPWERDIKAQYPDATLEKKDCGFYYIKIPNFHFETLPNGDWHGPVCFSANAAWLHASKELLNWDFQGEE